MLKIIFSGRSENQARRGHQKIVTTLEMSEIKGNGNVKGIKRSLSMSEDEDVFLGFDTGEIQ